MLAVRGKAGSEFPFWECWDQSLLRSKEAGAAAPVCDPEFVQSYEPDLRL